MPKYSVVWGDSYYPNDDPHTKQRTAKKTPLQLGPFRRNRPKEVTKSLVKHHDSSMRLSTESRVMTPNAGVHACKISTDLPVLLSLAESFRKENECLKSETVIHVVKEM